MAFAQLTYRESLRDIEACLRAMKAIPLFLIGEKQELKIFTDDAQLNPQPGDQIISLAGAVEETG